MPPKKKFEERSIPEWAFELEDHCLREVVFEAYVARATAVFDGALKYAACSAAFDSADAVMDQIRLGRYRGAAACRKAAAAVRKYNTALECASPTATHYSRRRDPVKKRRSR